MISARDGRLRIQVDISARQVDHYESKPETCVE